MRSGLSCVLMRGGTSKAVFLKEQDLPKDLELRRQIILGVFGSPDRRQIDGLGGGDPLTSKLAIIDGTDARPEAAGTDVTYTFGQVELDHPEIDWLSLCGNITSAVGVYALQEGYVAKTAPVSEVRVFNTNLGRVLTVQVPVADGEIVEAGDYVVPGVPGSGAQIDIDFSQTQGGATGKLLPTGNPVDLLDVPGVGPIAVSLVDIGNAHVFIRAADLGLRGIESAAEIDANAALRETVEKIRGFAAERMGLISQASASREESPATPLVGIVSPPQDFVAALTGERIRAADIDLVSRIMFMQQAHKTYAGTSTVCTGVASHIEGTLVHEVTRRAVAGRTCIGHPAGTIVTETSIEGMTVRRATLGRTARRIMEGTVFLPQSVVKGKS